MIVNSIIFYQECKLFILYIQIRFTSQLKYVDDTDLTTIGMTRPEMRRLKKYFEKEFPQTAMGKIKKVLIDLN